MRIIDAHLHMFPPERPQPGEAPRPFCGAALEDIRQRFQAAGVVHGVVMGNHGMEPGYFPSEGFHYCFGVEGDITRKCVEQVEAAFRSPGCVGLKLYPGYQKAWITDPEFTPLYELAEQYHMPVAVHTGQTAFAGAKLKYCHPMVLDDLAVDFPRVQFVMCHYGNPFLAEAAAVVEKNHNVAADLSGLLEWGIDLDCYMAENRAYMQMLSGWIAYTGAWDRFLFGSDFPGADLADSIRFVGELIPEKYHQAVFFDNANRCYGLGL